MKSCENKLSWYAKWSYGKTNFKSKYSRTYAISWIFKLFNGIDGIKYLVTQAGLPEFLLMVYILGRNSVSYFT